MRTKKGVINHLIAAAVQCIFAQQILDKLFILKSFCIIQL